MAFQILMNFLLVSRNYYRRQVKTFLLKKNDELAEEDMNNIDLNKNGTIEYDEFVELINFITSEKGYKLP